MTSRSRFFAESRLRRSELLVVVDATITGPTGHPDVELIFDTGASATTLIPEIASSIGYGPQDSFRDATVHTAVGRESGYWIHVA